MKNLWIITRDKIEDGAAKGTGSPHLTDEDCSKLDLAKNIDQILQDLIEKYEMDVAFKLYDDDDNLYYEGFMQEADFDPLDDFGMPNSGCTYLMYSEGKGEGFQLL